MAIDNVVDNMLILDEYLPYQDAVFTSTNIKAKDIKIVILPSNRGGYNVKAVPKSFEDKTFRKEFPLEWSSLINEELEKRLNVNRYDLILAMESNISPLSLEKEYDNKKDDAFSLEAILASPKENNLLDLLTLNDALKKLNEKEKLLIHLRFYNEYSQKYVAIKFNVSQVQISRMEKQIIEKLKKSFV